jgi:hypothetical protein
MKNNWFQRIVAQQLILIQAKDEVEAMKTMGGIVKF